MSVVVVSGLATGVGKTTATAAIVQILREKGRDVVPVKVARLGTSVAGADIGTIEKLTGIRGEDFSSEEDPLAKVRDFQTRELPWCLKVLAGLAFRY